MIFRISEVMTAHFPDSPSVKDALQAHGVAENNILNALHAFECTVDSDNKAEGYQIRIAGELVKHLTTAIVEKEKIIIENPTYCPRLNEKADLALAKSGSQKRIYFEIEFRPNVEKDLVKFQIGYNSSLLGAAVLVLATDRRGINPAYTTMPEFPKFKRLIQELRPVYPLLLCGIGGNAETSGKKLVTEAKTQQKDMLELPKESRKASRSNAGSALNQDWGVGARHSLYHKQGVFYMPLQSFPGAYFDQNGYILFSTERAFKE